LPPPTRLARKHALVAKQESLLRKSLSSGSEEGILASEARRVGTVDDIDLTRLNSPSGAPIPERIPFFNR